MRPQKNGFTLLDLLIVVVILGIVATIAIPRFQTLAAEAKLNAAASEIVAGLQYAAGLAIRHRRPFAFSADVRGNWFKIYDTDPYPDKDLIVRPNNDPPVDQAGVVLDPNDKTWYEKDFDTWQTYNGVRISSLPDAGEVRFYPDGHTGNSDSTITISLGNDRRTITVGGFNGRISVE